MVLDRKHFDDIDDFCDFDDKLEASSEGELGEHAPHHPLSWRRIIIEKAANNVKKVLDTKMDLQAAYKKGDLVFDEEAHKFGRVVESKPGFLNLSLLGGGNMIRRDINQLDFIRDNRHNLTLHEMASRLVISEIEVIALLNQLELEADRLVKEHDQPKTIAMPKKKVVAKDAHQLDTKKKFEIKVAKEAVKLHKPAVKFAAKAKDARSLKKNPSLSLTKEMSVSFARLLPKGATTDPIMDPNGYIQQNFLMMSNKELAVATGLSEHTIRRKLGEWNLKRKDFVNKA